MSIQLVSRIAVAVNISAHIRLRVDKFYLAQQVKPLQLPM